MTFVIENIPGRAGVCRTPTRTSHRKLREDFEAATRDTDTFQTHHKTQSQTFSGDALLILLVLAFGKFCRHDVKRDAWMCACMRSNVGEEKQKSLLKKTIHE